MFSNRRFSHTAGTWFGGWHPAWLLAGGVGASLAYLLDPDRGRRRRRVLVDKLEHYGRSSARLFGKAERDLFNRVIGLLAEARRTLSPAEVDDDVLVARARSKLGRYASHPHALTVQAVHGAVTLAGPVLEDEHRRLVTAIARVPGVKGVHDRLERHTSAEHVPLLQRGARRAGAPAEFLQRSWTPSLRVGAVATGLGLIALGVRRRYAALAVPAGCALLSRAISDRPLAALLGAGELQDGFELKKSVTIRAPMERVFGLLTAFEQYPQLMAHVARVERAGGSHFRWTVKGRAGAEVQWESELLELIPEQRVTFGHVGDRRGEHVARIRFERAGDFTRVHIDLRYLPRFGAVGVGLARLLGAHPKRLLDADLVIVKSLLEDGRARVNGRQIAASDLARLLTALAQPQQ